MGIHSPRFSRVRSALVAAALVAAGTAGVAGAANAAAQPLYTAHTVTGCGELLTVRVPSTAASTNAASLASALNLTTSDPLVRLAVQHHVRWLSTLSCKAKPGIRHTPATRGRTPSSALASANWSGYSANETNPTEVYAQWVVPFVTYSGSSTGATEYSSIWPGMGGGPGAGNGELIQDGTEQDAWCNSFSGGSCNDAGSQYFFWFELYPEEAEQQVTNLVPTGGETVYAMTAYQSNTQAEFYLCDLTQNACVYGYQSSIPPANSIELIVERPQVNGTWYPLPDFGQAVLSDANGYWGTTGAGTLAAMNPQQMNMYNTSYTTQLDSTGGIGSDGQTFGVQWLRAD